MQRIPEKVIDEIAEKSDPLTLIGEYTSLNKKGGRYWGLCPFHNEKTPSFSVTPEKGLYYCFGCGKGGSVFQFIMDVENVSFVEAAQILAEKCGVEIGEIDKSQEDGQEKKRREIRRLNSKLVETFGYFLTETSEGKTALDYLKNRGITQKIAEKFKLGFHPEKGRWLHSFLKERHYSDSFLAETGLFSKNHPEFSLFTGRIIFPINDRRGEIIGFGGRILHGDGPKYINSPESDIFLKRKNLYGLRQAAEAIRKLNEVIVVEGYMDVLACHEAGVENVVAPLGTAFTEEQVKSLRKYSENIIFFFDADSAGMRAAYKASNLCERFGFNIRGAVQDQGMDPGNYIESGQVEKLREIIKKSINIFDFLLEKTLNVVNIQGPEGKKALLKALFPYIRSVESQVTRESHLNALADLLGVTTAAVTEDFNRNNREDFLTAEPQAKKETGQNTSELFLMLAVCANRDLFKDVRKNLILEDLRDPKARELYIALEDSFRLGEKSIELLLEKIETENIKNEIMRAVSSDEYNINQESVVSDTITRIKIQTISRKKEKLDRELIIQTDQGRQQDLQLEIMYLNKELEKLKG